MSSPQSKALHAHPVSNLPSPELAPLSVSLSPASRSESKSSSHSSSPSGSESHPTTAKIALAQPARMLILPHADSSTSLDGLSPSHAPSESVDAQPPPSLIECDVSTSSDASFFVTPSNSMATSFSSSSASPARLSSTQNSLAISFESISLASPASTSPEGHASRLTSESPLAQLLNRTTSSDSLRIQPPSLPSCTSSSEPNLNPTSDNSPPTRQSTTLPSPSASDSEKQQAYEISARPPLLSTDSLSVNTDAASESQPQTGSTPSQCHKTSNVYINGLPPYFPEDELYALTKPFGVVKSVRSFTRRVGDRCSGYGFVLFDSIESAELCIETLRKHRNLHPSFSKQVHKIPGVSYTSSDSDLRQDGGTDGTRENREDGELSFKEKMDKLADKMSTNLYFEGLPMSIDEPTLAALVSPYAIKSSRFFQTKLSHPPRIIAFVRLETREAAEEIIERLHGRMVRGWNDPGSRISVRFADNSEQRELRRNERLAREGEGSPARLTIAQASLLNLHGKELQARAPNPFVSHSVAPIPPASPYSHPNFMDNGFPRPRHESMSYQAQESDSEYMLGLSSVGVVPSSGEQLQYLPYQPRRADMVDASARLGLPMSAPSILSQGHAQSSGFTPTEELILQAHSQGQFYENYGANAAGAALRLGAGSPGLPLVSPHQQLLTLQHQQAALLAQQQQSAMSYLHDSQHDFNSRHLQFSTSKARHAQSVHPLAAPRAQLSSFDQQQPYSLAASPVSYSAQSNVQNSLRSTKDVHLSNSVLSNQQRHYQSTQHKTFQQNNSISNKGSVSNTNTNKRANRFNDIIIDNVNTTTGSPFFEYNQNHHDDAMRHDGDVHRYTSGGSYDHARFVVQPFPRHGRETAAKYEANGSSPLMQVSPALTYNSSRTPSTLSPATPFFGSFSQAGEVFEGNNGYGKRVKMVQ